VFLTQSAGFTLGFEQRQNIAFTDWALDVADNGTMSIIQKFDADLEANAFY
jgi:hypothetical protein